MLRLRAAGLLGTGKLGEKVRQRHVPVDRTAVFSRHFLRFNRRDMAAASAADLDGIAAELADGLRHGVSDGITHRPATRQSLTEGDYRLRELDGALPWPSKRRRR